MSLSDDLVLHLGRLQTAPFLFVGSGFSRRYANSPDWKGLLRHFADSTNSPYERYVSRYGSDDLPRIASAIADDFHDVWWDGDDFKDSRGLYPSPQGPSSPLKIEVARLLADLDGRLPEEGGLADELNQLRSATVEGVITTNFDSLLESVFPGFRVFSGQDELLFHDAVGVGEIYKIHGSITDPESLVLTAEDYDRFTDRNVYLAAKLLTIFVEHPVVFLGYSLEDDNVREILTSIASVLTKNNIEKLQDRLIFIQWHEEPVASHLSPAPFPLDGLSLPMVAAHVNDFSEVFDALGKIRRRFPTKFLHELKEEVYELVRTSSPKGRLYVQDIDSDVDTTDIDVVIGVGVRAKLASEGIVGLQRRELLKDVIDSQIPDGDPAIYQQIVTKVLPKFLTGTTNTPIFKYLRGAGELTQNGEVIDSSRFPAIITKRVTNITSALRAPGGYVKKALQHVTEFSSLAGLIDNCSMDDVLFAIPHLDPSGVDVEQLRAYLKEQRGVFEGSRPLQVTQWAKCVCFLDYVEFGRSTE
ncbi:SIR2 family protein [Curtobacterium sp. RHCKG23]|uniref:SIR2 family protein n=1 Tax=Curtobacterium citri TaxID=3055139 RepID=A0ABT7T6Z2_9MICO|nr:SIR2 family protein [Curtobacterium citri]MDM7885139.1 SIR2 family protein [Curtobacterium citri]